VYSLFDLGLSGGLYTIVISHSKRKQVYTRNSNDTAYILSTRRLVQHTKYNQHDQYEQAIQSTKRIDPLQKNSKIGPYTAYNSVPLKVKNAYTIFIAR